MFFNKLKTKDYDNRRSKLTEKCIWAMLVDDGVVKNKGGGYTCVYEFTAPDISSASRNRVDYIAAQFNNSLI